MPDPSGSTVRKAFLLEAFLNLLSFPLLTNTRGTLSFLLRDPGEINDSTVLFARLFGGVIIGGLTTALIYGARHIPSRRNTYWTLGMGEVLLIPILALEASKQKGALSTRAAIGSIGLLLPPLLWRIFVLYVRPEMIGNERASKKNE
nr:uncharacterized protein I303_08230 [Kwoniella dejecticola CBS 10117]OBR81460.1 hypothetical protein I303_08230 [Kwoniella dejecticola CBS 10117]